jgi:hypothetical protein
MSISGTESTWYEQINLVVPCAPLTSNYKGFHTFVKQKSIVVNRAAIDHEIWFLFSINTTA